MTVPTIKVRIAAHPKSDLMVGYSTDPLVELVSIEEIVNSQPAITAAVNDFIKRHRAHGIKFGQVTVQRV